MKLLLTSGGVRTKAIASALLDMVGKPASETTIAFIPTAANVEPGNKDWYVNQFLNLWRYGFSIIDIVDPSAAQVTDWRLRLSTADVIFISGGNSFHLLEQARVTGLADWLSEHIAEKVYVGSSAGSIIMTPFVGVANVQGADTNLTHLQDLSGLGFVPFEFFPHAISFFAEEEMEAYARLAEHPVYAADDTTAIQMVDDAMTIISEGYNRLLT